MGWGCGDYPELLSDVMPNVLMIGDSISMDLCGDGSYGGYGGSARHRLLERSIASWHNGGWDIGGQASNSAKGLLCTDPTTPRNWLNFTGTYDVITFNFGLHDIRRPPYSEAAGEKHVTLAEYGTNLATIYSRLSARAKKVIWVTTTPVPNVPWDLIGRDEHDVIAYNAKALEVLEPLAEKLGHTLLVADLHASVDAYCGANYESCSLQQQNDVHFTCPQGTSFLATRVVDKIVAALPN
jgi:hypothetical protein